MDDLLLNSSSPASQSPTQWVILIGAILVTIYLVMIRPMRKRQAARDPLAKSPGQTSISQQKAIERDMAAVLVEYEQMIRRMTAQVDTRAAKLEILIKEADELLGSLRQTLDAARAAPVDAPRAALAAAPVAPEQVTPQPAPRVSPPSPAPLPAVSNASRHTVAVQTNGAAHAKPAVEPIPPDDDPAARYAEVYSLAEAGFSTREIAQEMGRPVNEVDLILALRKRVG